MTKKLILLILCFEIPLITSCNNKNSNFKTDTKNKEEQTLKIEEQSYNSERVAMVEYEKTNIICSQISAIADYNSNYSLFITNDGSLYQISFKKIFSNNTNCNKIETDEKFNRFVNGGIISKDNKVFSYSDGILEEVDVDNVYGWILNPFLKNVKKDDYINVNSYSTTNNNKFSLRKGNNIYMYVDGTEKTKLEDEPIFTAENNDEIIYSLDYTIKTKKKFYNFYSKIINKDECEKYADVKCQLQDGFYELDSLNKIYDSVKFYKPSIIVTNNNEIYIPYI